MPNQLFPPEILEYSAESYYAKLSIHSKILYFSVLLFIVTAIALLPFIEIDVTAQSRGVIRSPMENIMLQSSIYGEVIDYRLRENKNVSAGDTLIVFNTAQIDEQILLETEKKEQNKRFIEDIDRMLKNIKPQTFKYIAAYNLYKSKIKEQQIQIDFLRKDYKTTTGLYEKLVVSKFDYLTSKNNLEKAESSLTSLKEDSYASWQNDQTGLEIENQSVESNIRQLEKNKRNYVITAPSSGTLVQVAGFQTGNFIAPNQAIAYISSSDSLLTECYISPSDIGSFGKGKRLCFSSTHSITGNGTN